MSEIMYLIKNKVKKVILNNEKQRQFYYSYTSGGLNRPGGFIAPSNFLVQNHCF